MLIEINRENKSFLECFSSESRIHIIELLNDRPMNIKELAAELGVSSAIVTKHIQKLEEAGIVQCEGQAGIRGTQKICRLALTDVHLIVRKPKQASSKQYTVSIPVGQYASFSVKPTCGLASSSKLLGIIDDPRYFAHPSHVEANHIWFGSGFVEYRIPNFLLNSQAVTSLEITCEICSEAPQFNESAPSDISFYVNGILLGVWTSPGDFGAQRGAYTPEWFNLGSSHGLHKTILINKQGAYIDGVQLSPVSVDQLQIGFDTEIRFRIACHEDAEHCGGLNLFGRHCGNYDQDIVVTVSYESK